MFLKRFSLVMIISLMLLSGCSQQKTQTTTSDDSINTVEEYGPDATKIVLSESLTISKGGEYVLSGELKDGSVTVNTNEVVHIFLENASITSTSSSPINVESASKVVVTILKDTTNTITDSRKTTTDATGAAIYSKDDLVINGTGTLNISSTYNNGIESNDDLLIVRGTINVNSVNNGIKGQNTLKINDGTIKITGSQDGLKADNEEEGNIIINGGTIDISSSDDGINALNNVEINNGNITISAKGDGITVNKTITIKAGIINIKKSYEGLEAYSIVIDGGNIKINSSDDGINITDSSIASTDDPNAAAIDGSLTINAGDVYVNSEGDGLDSNGSIYMNGGNVVVDGPTNDGNGGLDYNGEFKITAGNLVIFGKSGMGQATSNSSTQNTFLYNLNTQVSAGSKITLLNSSNEVIMEYTNAKVMNSVVMSSPKITNGKYTLQSNGKTIATINISGVVTSNGTSMQPGMN